VSPAAKLLGALMALGARVELTGNRLLLRAGSKAIPAELVSRFRGAKAELVAALRTAETSTASADLPVHRPHGPSSSISRNVISPMGPWPPIAPHRVSLSTPRATVSPRPRPSCTA
jgi:hypothetical protein